MITPQDLPLWSLRIAIAALTISALSLGISFWNAWRVGRLQARKLEQELADAAAARERANEADVRVELQRNPDRIVLHNAGAAPALNVTLAFDSLDPIIASEHAKLPVARMAHGAVVPLDAAFSHDSAPPFDVTVRWTTGGGEPRERKERVY